MPQAGHTTLYAGNLLGRMGLSADIGYRSYFLGLLDSVGDYDVSPADAKILTFWRDLYDGIGRANMLIKYIDKPQLDEATRNNIYGQALFLRAYYHFLLVVRFHNIPLILSVPEDGNRESVQTPQSSTRDVYLQIIKDMEEAAPLVRTAAELQSPGRVSQSTVYGMLARVALYMAGYPVKEPGMYAKAKEYAQKVIDTGSHAMNASYEQVFINYIQDKYDAGESLFEVEFWGTNEGTYTTTAGMVGPQQRHRLFEHEHHRRHREIGRRSLRLLHRRDPHDALFLHALRDRRPAARLDHRTLHLQHDDGHQDRTNVEYLGSLLRQIPPRIRTQPTAIDQLHAHQFPAAALLRHPADLGRRRRRRPRQPQRRRPETSLRICQPGAPPRLRKGHQHTRRGRRSRNRRQELPVGGHQGRAARANWASSCSARTTSCCWGEFYDRMRYARSLAAAIPDSYTSSYYVNARRTYNNVNRRDEIWPIPTYELGVNRALVQNPGW